MAFVCGTVALRHTHALRAAAISLHTNFHGVPTIACRRLQPPARLYASVSPPSPPPPPTPSPPSAAPADSRSRSSSSSSSDETAKQPADLRLLWDSDCPLCVKEVDFLKGRAERLGASIDFIDIASGDYSAEENAGVDYATAMGKIHAVKGDGTVLVGIAAFRASYEAVGLGWVYAFTALPGVSGAATLAYDFWARNRLRWTGRPELEEILEARAKRTCR